MTKWTEEMAARAASMKRAGIPLATIAARLGVSPKAVKEKTLKLGATRRLTGVQGPSRTGHRGRIFLNKLPESAFEGPSDD